MAIVKTNVEGLVTIDDIRKNSQLVFQTMRKIQTGSKIPSAQFDPTAAVVADLLSRNLGTLAVSQESLSRASAMMDVTENAMEQITEKLTSIKQVSERVVTGQITGDYAQTVADELYADIRRISRDTRFGETALLRGGMGNSVEYVTTTAGQIAGSLTAANFDVTGVNLQGFASLAPAQSQLGNLVNVSEFLPTLSVPMGGAAAPTATVELQIGGGVATAALMIGGVNAFTETIAMTTGPQTLEFSNLGLRVNLAQAGFNYSVSGVVTVGIDRDEAKFLAGTNVNALGDQFRFDLPNLEPENLLEAGAGGQMFTVDLRNAPAQAIGLVERAISTIESTRSRVGVLRQGISTQMNKVSELVLGHQLTRSTISDTDFPLEALNLTARQVAQRTAVSMLSQARLNPQLVLQLFR